MGRVAREQSEAISVELDQPCGLRFLEQEENGAWGGSGLFELFLKFKDPDLISFFYHLYLLFNFFPKELKKITFFTLFKLFTPY